ncbi:uncharacterized protein LOC117341062 isoform X1 [Pecten maximus]|uniref:uncharacterized protein LOC117341062 isoform X1 n=1 Tax=Pecten maximus TaxID=6579 RepID=UPI0014582ABB|nr:uncharacterized protein LOC117341062 isoform X1 [Pecten maximus]XP_033758782.1 uncharacterized protein LOC117341062 isoform X1 [Pecten maximus]XP_033758783.1 uncharacterized protein LOC117341062 isoform X1 [Pecten maximus]XP_033758784.1 uncharacterized protein LOC117341062 isoform X1 [Pecten maximus]
MLTSNLELQLSDHRFTWHGRADVLLNQIIAVQILDEQVDASKIDSPLNTQDTNDSEQEDGEPAWKKLRPHSDGIISAVNAIEVNSKNGKDTLYDLHVLDRIVAEAVTNSFTQVYSQASLADLLIPTVATTSKYFTILLYDPVNDILLQDVLRFSIWEYPEDARLNLFSVVCLWLFFNFTTFVRKTSLWRNEIETVESEFHKILDLKLERYKKISTDNKTQTEILNDQEGSSYGEILDLSCQRIKRNREI